MIRAFSRAAVGLGYHLSIPAIHPMNNTPRRAYIYGSQAQEEISKNVLYELGKQNLKDLGKSHKADASLALGSLQDMVESNLVMLSQEIKFTQGLSMKADSWEAKEKAKMPLPVAKPEEPIKMSIESLVLLKNKGQATGNYEKLLEYLQNVELTETLNEKRASLNSTAKEVPEASALISALLVMDQLLRGDKEISKKEFEDALTDIKAVRKLVVFVLKHKADDYLAVIQREIDYNSASFLLRIYNYLMIDYKHSLSQGAPKEEVKKWLLDEMGKHISIASIYRKVRESSEYLSIKDPIFNANPLLLCNDLHAELLYPSMGKADPNSIIPAAEIAEHLSGFIDKPNFLKGVLALLGKMKMNGEGFSEEVMKRVKRYKITKETLPISMQKERVKEEAAKMPAEKATQSQLKLLISLLLENGEYQSAENLRAQLNSQSILEKVDYDNPGFWLLEARLQCMMGKEEEACNALRKKINKLRGVKDVKEQITGNVSAVDSTKIEKEDESESSEEDSVGLSGLRFVKEDKSYSILLNTMDNEEDNTERGVYPLLKQLSENTGHGMSNYSSNLPWFEPESAANREKEIEEENKVALARLNKKIKRKKGVLFKRRENTTRKTRKKMSLEAIRQKIEKRIEKIKEERLLGKKGKRVVEIRRCLYQTINPSRLSIAEAQLRKEKLKYDYHIGVIRGVDFVSSKLQISVALNTLEEYAKIKVSKMMQKDVINKAIENLEIKFLAELPRIQKTVTENHSRLAEVANATFMNTRSTLFNLSAGRDKSSPLDHSSVIYILSTSKHKLQQYTEAFNSLSIDEMAVDRRRELLLLLNTKIAATSQAVLKCIAYLAEKQKNQFIELSPPVEVALDPVFPELLLLEMKEFAQANGFRLLLELIEEQLIT